MTTTAFGAILVPLDGSTVAEQALSVGAAMARRAGASLHLVSVGPSTTATEQYLEWIAGAARAVDGALVFTALLHGPQAAAISQYIRTQSIDLVVMTTRGHGGVKRWCLGSVAQELLRGATCPVLLLHAQELPQPTEFKRILVALDGEMDDPALQPALALGSLHEGCRYFITQVVEPTIPILTRLAVQPAHLGSDFDERREIVVRNYLASLSDKLREQGLRVTPQLLVGRGIADQVLELAKALRVDCIAVGTHGLRGMERVLLGSVADKVVREAEMPVLVIPPQATKRRAAPPAVQSAEVAG